MCQFLSVTLSSIPKRSVRFVGLLGLTILAGCNNSTSGFNITGRVEFQDGKPVDKGMIEFEGLDNPAAARGSAVILDGNYSIPPTARLVPGKYRVRIYQSGERPAITGPPGSDKPTAVTDLVSDEFNVRSELLAEITGDTHHEFDFQVERSK